MTIPGREAGHYCFGSWLIYVVFVDLSVIDILNAMLKLFIKKSDPLDFFYYRLTGFM